MKVYVDGGCKGNGGVSPECYGSFKIGEEAVARREYMHLLTNNEAEYQALIDALTQMREKNIKEAEIFTDSRLVVGQLTQNWKVKALHLRPLVDKARELLQSYKLQWLSRDYIEKELGH